MKTRKRNGYIQSFNKDKIKKAIIKANNDTDDYHKILVDDIDAVVDEIIIELTNGINNQELLFGIEEIQDAVELVLQRNGYYTLAKNYIKYRYKRELVRAFKKRDDEVLDLITGQNDEANKENSNKDTRIIPTMRDYIAGFSCKEIAQRIIIPKDIVDAHQQGIIHFHKLIVA